MNSAFSEDGVDPIGSTVCRRMRRACVAGPPRLSFICLLNKLGHGKRARAVDADEQVKLAFNRLHLGDVDVKEADRVVLELRSLRLAFRDIRQARDAVALKVPMQH